MKINKPPRYGLSAALGLAGLLLASVPAAALSSDLDVDGNGVADALTDGLLVIRYLFGFTGNTLTDGAIGSGCTRCNAEEITGLLQCGGLIFGRYLPIGEDNGIIRDVATGLEWKRCSVGQTWNQSTCRCNGSAVPYDWYDAINLTASTAVQLANDRAPIPVFRTPTIDELRTLVHCSSDDPIWINMKEDYAYCQGTYDEPTIVDEAFPDTPYAFWSSSPYAGNSDYAWWVYFYDGHVGYYSKSYQRYVRLVRGGQ